MNGHTFFSRVLSRRILGRCTTAGLCGVNRHVPCGCWSRSAVGGEPKHVGVKPVSGRTGRLRLISAAGLTGS